ncbi:threonine ammonia-lyase IlvA [Candidatus Nomurabacteria bacterium]|nr:threonine ammonia-lyase IlvA [Candidatus Nomurabacteria bacterium]
MQRLKLIKEVEKANNNLDGVITRTPLILNKRLSKKYGANIFLKREDLQVVRSYKLRGAYNKISNLSKEEKKRGVVCASAGNHAQGVAFACFDLKVKGHIFMPLNTPKQKVDRVREFGDGWTEIVLVGDTYDDAHKEAMDFCKKKKSIFVHPFDDLEVIAGQGTIGVEIMEKANNDVDVVVVPIGGGGLVAGLGSYVKSKNKKTKIFGVEPLGAPSMTASLKKGKVVKLDHIEKFVDGAAVKEVGQETFAIAKKLIDAMHTVPEGKVCTEMISLYQHDGIVAEPAGTLSVAVLDQIKKDIKGKNIVCIISGGNNDLSRFPEIVDKSLIYEGLKHYFIVDFPQRPGALKLFLEKALGKNDDITLFEYIKKNARERGPALVGIELSKKEDLEKLMKRMTRLGFHFEKLESDSPMFRFLV